MCKYSFNNLPLVTERGTPLQYSCLENPMDGGAWWAAVHGVAKSQTWLSDFPFTFHFHALEKEMATHSSVLAWRVPGMEEPGGLLSMGSHSQTRLKRLSSSSSSHWTSMWINRNLNWVPPRYPEVLSHSLGYKTIKIPNIRYPFRKFCMRVSGGKDLCICQMIPSY